LPVGRCDEPRCPTPGGPSRACTGGATSSPCEPAPPRVEPRAPALPLSRERVFPAQLASTLVSHQGVDQLVQLPLQDAVELLEGEPDAVVGDAVVLVVVRPD